MPPSVKIAYLILAHQHPDQLTRLLRRLHAFSSKLFVHIDSAVDWTPFRIRVAESRELKDVSWVPRARSAWATFGAVQAALNGIRCALNCGFAFDHVVLLSGQDYPLKSRSHITNFFEESVGISYMANFPLPTERWLFGGLDRIERYHFMLFGRRFTHPPYRQPWNRKRQALHILLNVLLRTPRAFPHGVTPYGGSQWWSLSRAAARYVLETAEARPDLVRFYRYCNLSDEMFFQTILMNSHLADSIRNQTVTHLRWSDGSKHPAVFEEKDLPELLSTKCLFARKFDPSRSAVVLDQLDEQFSS